MSPAAFNASSVVFHAISLSNAHLQILHTSPSHVSLRVLTIFFASLAFNNHLTDSHSADFHIITGSFFIQADNNHHTAGSHHHNANHNQASSFVGNLHSLTAVYIGVSNAHSVAHHAIAHFTHHQANLEAHEAILFTHAISQPPTVATISFNHLPILPAVVFLFHNTLEKLLDSSSILCFSARLFISSSDNSSIPRIAMMSCKDL